MHLPELALDAGGIGSLGSQDSFVMDRYQRKVTKNGLHFVRISVYQTLEQGSGPRAVWSLKVRIFDNHQRGIGRALGPIAFPHFWDLPARL